MEVCAAGIFSTSHNGRTSCVGFSGRGAALGRPTRGLLSVLSGYVLILVLALCTTVAAELVEVKVLADFSSDDPLRGWELRQVKAESGVRQGRAVRLRYPAWEWWRGEWPAAILEIGQGMFDAADWSSYDRLVFEVHSENDLPAPLKLRLDDREERRVVRLFNIPPEQTYTCQLAIAELTAQINTSQIVYFDLYMSQPATDYSLVLESIRLEADELKFEEAELSADPFGGGKVRARIRLNRPARCEVRVLDETGEIAASYEEHAARLEWLWEGGKPGEYQVEVRAEDTAWHAGEVVRDLGSFAVLPADERPERVVWTEPTTRKVMLHSRPRIDREFFTWDDVEAGRGPAVRIDMVQNEWAGAQVVFLGRRDSLRFRFAVEELRHVESDSVFPLESSAVYQVGYVLTENPQLYAVDFNGWWPDPLLPAEEMRSEPGECMPVWISLKSEATTEPGIYRGRLGIWREGRRAGSLPLEVRVYDVALPDSTTVRTAFSLYDDMLTRVYGEVPGDLYRKYQEFIADHRLNVDHLYRSTLPRIEDLEHFAGRDRLNAFNLLYVRAGEDYDRRRLQEIAAVLDPFVEELRRRGLADRAYIYGFDEVEIDQFDEMKRVFGFLKERYPDVKTATTARDPGLGMKTDLDEVVDIWIPLTAVYDRQTANAARARGDEVWWYICISPPHPFANWFVEYPAIEARLLWWMTYRQGVTGFLYYTMNRWPNQKTVMRVDGRNRTNWNPASYETANGDGSLFYAGPDGPITTIRMENVRDGIEDYELLRLLDGDSARALCDRLIRSLVDYSRDAKEFRRVRTELLERLEARQIVDGR